MWISTVFRVFAVFLSILQYLVVATNNLVLPLLAVCIASFAVQYFCH